jgi:hypothetical protein
MFAWREEKVPFQVLLQKEEAPDVAGADDVTACHNVA